MGSEETRERLDIDFSSSHSEEHAGESPEGEGEEVEKDGAQEEGEEEKQETDSVPAAEGLKTVKTVIEEASTSMQEQSGLAAGLDVGSPSLPHITSIQSEVIAALTVYQVYLAFIRELNADPHSVFSGSNYL